MSEGKFISSRHKPVKVTTFLGGERRVGNCFIRPEFGDPYPHTLISRMMTMTEPRNFRPEKILTTRIGDGSATEATENTPIDSAKSGSCERLRSLRRTPVTTSADMVARRVGSLPFTYDSSRPG